jgi:hypothetical protein
MSELNQMGNLNDLKNNIKEEITSNAPNSDHIITYLFKLRRLLWKNLPEFYDIVGETFQLYPEFFMEYIYGNTLFNRPEITKYILEKFCLYDEEKILMEFPGDIKQVDDIQSNIYVEVKGGTIYVTNYRIIAQGNLKIKGHSLNAYIWGGPILWSLSGGSKKRKSREGIIEGSSEQELPCYGYQFKRKNLSGLKRKTKPPGVKYLVLSDELRDISGDSEFKQRVALGKAMRIITIKPPLEQIDELYNNLLLREDVDAIVERFQGVINMGLSEKIKRNSFVKSLQFLWELKEYDYLSVPEKLDVVLGVYKLDPKFFMSSVFPAMNSWKMPAFLEIKSELAECLSKEGDFIN